MPRMPLNPLMFSDTFKDVFIDTVGTTTVKLPKGIYQVVSRGAGGAGGQNSNTSGGAGGKGLLKQDFITLTANKVGSVVVGAAGITRANGGNGGSKGDSTDAPQKPGDGGGGGHASYLLLDGLAYGANGGGGGGGAGGSDTNNSRYSDGGSGGGGGGYYRLEIDGSETDVPGQKGGKGAVITQ
jgi:hypothetical protein